MKLTNLQSEINKIGELFVKRYKQKLKEGDTYATGKLYNSVTYKLIKTENGIKLNFGALNYWVDIENGRDAMVEKPELDENKIKAWLIVKGIKPINPKMKIDRLAHIITNSIFNGGIERKPYLKKTSNEILTKVINTRLQRAFNKDLKELQDEFKDK